MDALDLLKEDHDQAKILFNDFKNQEKQREKRSVFQKIDDILTLHSHIEETVFYPTFSKYDEFTGILKDFFEDHKEIDQLLIEIENLDQNSLEIEARVNTLMEKVLRHVEREENELFPMVRKVMKRSEREVLGRHLKTAKQEKSAAA